MNTKSMIITEKKCLSLLKCHNAKAQMVVLLSSAGSNKTFANKGLVSDALKVTFQDTVS